MKEEVTEEESSYMAIDKKIRDMLRSKQLAHSVSLTLLAICFDLLQSCRCGTAETKMKFSMKDFFSKCDQMSSFLRIWSHLLKKPLMENIIFGQCILLFSSISISTFSNINIYFEFSEIPRKVQKSLKRYLVKVN